MPLSPTDPLAARLAAAKAAYASLDDDTCTDCGHVGCGVLCNICEGIRAADDAADHAYDCAREEGES